MDPNTQRLDTPSIPHDDSWSRGGGLTPVLFLGVALVASAAWASPATDQVRASVDRVLAIVQDPELKKPANTQRRRAQIREVARGLFDFEEMAKRALARHWTQRTPEERQHFTELFTDLLEGSYVGKIEGYGGEKIVYLPEQVDGDTITVRSRIVTQRGTEIPVDYRLRRADGRAVAYDVLVEGVSLVSNYRAQFNKVIAQSSYQELVRKMERKQLELAEIEKAPGSKPKTP